VGCFQESLQTDGDAMGGGEMKGKGKGKAPPPPVPAGGKDKADVKGKGRIPYASCKNDKEWILAEVVRRPGCGALKFAHADLRRDEEFVLAVVSRDGSTWWDLEEDLQKNKRIVLAAISQLNNVWGWGARSLFRMLPDNLRLDTDVISAVGMIQLLADFSLLLEPEVVPDFDACRWIVVSLAVAQDFPFRSEWTSPRHMADVMLPPTTALEAANPLSRQIRGVAPVLAVNVEVCVMKLTGQHLTYTVAPDDTASALKARIAGDLDIPPFSVVLLLGAGPSEMFSDTPLSTYCEDGRPELKLSLMVTLRDVCLLTSQGSKDERSSKALGVLMERALPGDQLAVDAAHDCIRNEQWDSPLFVSALRLLKRLMPPDQACTFFAACLGLESANARAVALEAVLQLWHTEGKDFVESNACPQSGQEERTRRIMSYLAAVITDAGPRRVFSPEHCGSHPCVSFGKVDPMEALRRGTLGWGEIWQYAATQTASAHLFRIALDYDAGLVAAAWKLSQNPSLLEEIAEQYPVLVETLRYEAATLGVCLEDTLPNLMVTFVDGLGYPFTKRSGTNIMVMKSGSGVHTRYAAQQGRSDTSSIDNLSAIAMQRLSQNVAESARLVLEALAILAPRSHRGSLTAACYAGVHRDASVREQALELLLRVMQIEDVDYVSRLLETRRDVHAKRILREVLDYFQEPDRYLAEMGTDKLKYST